MQADNKNIIKQDFSNAATALILLQEWLSITESQICSTEVLAEHLPKINNLLETSMNSLSSHFANIAQSDQIISTAIGDISFEIDNIAIGGNKMSIENYIKSITDEVKDPQIVKKLELLSAAIKLRDQHIETEIRHVKQAVTKNTTEISEIVMGMQFQDRVSQNIIITINIMQTISEFIDKEISHSLPSFSKEDRKKLLNKEFASQLMQKFRLGELQHSFVDHLIKHGYIKDAAEVGFSTKIHDDKPASDDVELF